MRLLTVLIAALAAISLGCTAAAAGRKAPGAKSSALAPDGAIARDQLRVTLGQISALPDGGLLVEDAKVRAVAPGVQSSSAELRFKYLGPTAELTTLASGRVRRQLGLKMRARDGCNLVYVMWHIEPKQQVVVEVKRNEGASTHDECGAGGYTRIKPTRSVPAPMLVAGAEHRLRAELDGDALRVLADGVVVWEGMLGPTAVGLEGPVGLRTDNVRTEIRLIGR